MLQPDEGGREVTGGELLDDGGEGGLVGVQSPGVGRPDDAVEPALGQRVEEAAREDPVASTSAAAGASSEAASSRATSTGDDISRP
nr:hypothetical protein [Geodermatophilus amargosae]